MEHSYDVIVIGGGWSGLVTCKHMLQAKLSCVVFEKQDWIGGVWRYSDDPKLVTVMKNTITSSSKTITEISDFPMPDEFGHFPHHSNVFKYLKSYCDKFNLWPHIKLNTEIVEVKKKDDKWIVHTKKGERFTSKYLCVCSGTHQVPNEEVKDTVFKAFKGDVTHSISYKHPMPEHIGKKILIYGGGETASDIATELSYVADKVYCSIPHGQWFQHKLTKTGDPFDHFSSRLRRWGSPPGRDCPFLVYCLESDYGFQLHGLEEWRSPAKYYGQFFNKSPAVVDRVKEGFVIPLPDLEKVHSHKISFKNHKEVDIDTIILCTGYHPQFDFLPKEYTQHAPDRFKLIFEPLDPTLAFIGLIRPTVTSIPMMTELQVRCAVRVFTGKVKIPSKKEMLPIIEKDDAFLQKQFETTTHRIGGLVDPLWYANELSTFGQFKPNYVKLFFQNPYHWYRCITAPAHGCEFLLNEKKHRPYILNLYKKLKPKRFTDRYYLDTLGLWVVFPVIDACMRAYRRLRA